MLGEPRSLPSASMPRGFSTMIPLDSGPPHGVLSFPLPPRESTGIAYLISLSWAVHRLPRSFTSDISVISGINDNSLSLPIAKNPETGSCIRHHNWE
ncbi:hypothetical protein B0H19DRAFT_714241 [Mycena capillaripes]|nr:hypothetical protein B0H19DRAFT_714241 [Mycena capillaripes]